MAEVPDDVRPRTVTRLGRRVRSLATGLAILLITLGLAEGVAQLAARMVRLTPHRASLERRALLAKIPAEQTSASGGASTPPAAHGRYVDMAYGARYEIHPYFGHTMARNFGSANNHGFYTTETYPYVKGEHEYVIGIFGGSVAMQIAGGGKALAARLQPALRDRGFDKVTVLPFAAGGWRQPQSFYALVYYLDSIDMAIFVDGFNEMVTLSAAQLHGYPARFPMQNIFAPLASDSQSPYAAATLGKIALANDAARRATEMLNASPLRHSVLAHLAWRGLAASYTQYTARLRGDLGVAASEAWSNLEAEDDAEPRIESYVRMYTNILRYASIIANADHKPLFHFVQPNQHDRGSKPLSEEERSLITLPWLDIISSNYRRLDAMCIELRRDGVDSTFLGRMFASTPETVYADACCHFNSHGIQLLEDAIADHILASDEFGTNGEKPFSPMRQ